MNWFRKLFRLEAEGVGAPGPDADFWYQPIGYNDALQVATVWACVRVLAESLASMPFQVFRRTAGGGRDIAREHPLYRRIHDSPNDYFTAFEFWEMVMWSLLLRGNFLAVQHLTARQDLDWLEPLDWSKVQVTKDKQTGIRVFRYTPPDGGEVRQFVDSEVLFIPGPGYDGEKGKSVVDVLSRTIGISRVAQDYVHGYFENNGIPPAYISFPTGVGEPVLKNWADWFKKQFGGARNAGKLGIIPNGGEIKTVDIQHDKMQLNELRQFQVAEICRGFRVPPHLVQDLTRSTNNNIEHQGLDFWIHGVRPWANRIEARVNASLLGEREGQQYFAEFNMDALLRGDAETRAKAFATRISSGQMTPNEARAKENLPAMAGGDSLYMQGAMVRIEDVMAMGEDESPVDEEEPVNAN